MIAATGPSGLTPYLQNGWRVYQGSGWYLGQTEGHHYQAKGEPTDSAWKACNEGPSAWDKVSCRIFAARHRCTARLRLCLGCQFYLEDPERNATGATAEQRQLIIGGEASTWGDCISAESFDIMTWPAASSVAEVRLFALAKPSAFCISFQLCSEN